jgi:hypothetical protein
MAGNGKKLYSMENMEKMFELLAEHEKVGLTKSEIISYLDEHKCVPKGIVKRNRPEKVPQPQCIGRVQKDWRQCNNESEQGDHVLCPLHLVRPPKYTMDDSIEEIEEIEEAEKAQKKAKKEDNKKKEDKQQCKAIVYDKKKKELKQQCRRTVKDDEEYCSSHQDSMVFNIDMTEAEKQAKMEELGVGEGAVAKKPRQKKYANKKMAALVKKSQKGKGAIERDEVRLTDFEQEKIDFVREAQHDDEELENLREMYGEEVDEILQLLPQPKDEPKEGEEVEINDEPKDDEEVEIDEPKEDEEVEIDDEDEPKDDIPPTQEGDDEDDDELFGDESDSDSDSESDDDEPLDLSDEE